MSFRGLSIDERDRLRREAERKARAEERRMKEAQAEQAERDKLIALKEQHMEQQELVASLGNGQDSPGSAEDVNGELGDGAAKRLSVASRRHVRTTSGTGLDALLEQEAQQQQQMFQRMATGVAVNAAPTGSILRGFDAELQQKIQDKEDPMLGVHIGKWIEKVTGDPCFDLHVCLKNGMTLCKLIRTIAPDTMPASYNRKASVHLAQRDNIKLYLHACQKFGMSSSELFEISDLHENRNMSSVISNLVSLSRRARFSEGFDGPFLEAAAGISIGASLSTRNGDQEPGSEPPKAKSWHRRSRSGTWGEAQEGGAADGADDGTSGDSLKPAATPYKSSAPEFNQQPANKRVWSNQPAKSVTISAPPTSTPQVAASESSVPSTNKPPTQPKVTTGSSMASQISQLRAELASLKAENESLRKLVPEGSAPAADSTSSSPSSAAGSGSGSSPSNSDVPSKASSPSSAPTASSTRGAIQSRMATIRTHLDTLYRRVGMVVVWSAVAGLAVSSAYSVCVNHQLSSGTSRDDASVACDPLYLMRGYDWLRSFVSS